MGKQKYKPEPLNWTHSNIRIKQWYDDIYILSKYLTFSSFHLTPVLSTPVFFLGDVFLYTLRVCGWLVKSATWCCMSFLLPFWFQQWRFLISLMLPVEKAQGNSCELFFIRFAKPMKSTLKLFLLWKRKEKKEKKHFWDKHIVRNFG